ncbi:hypothetical protein HB852_07165 [Listeria grandensis]|uniref:ATP-grasp domain-containing protein n=1 Tax=Listeria grandensis TaxID=1494963 RepID=UPI0016259C02|nr:hypothetical protein [Listeria grandensis]MBC1474394.1 hypothetical protein [Listeria grandensis]
MIVIINSFSFLEMGLSEELIKKNKIKIVSPERVKLTFPLIQDKNLFLEDFTHDNIMTICQSLERNLDIDLFVANGEENIPIAGLLNEKLGLSSSFMQSIAFTDKYIMRTLVGNKVKQPNFIAVDNIDNIIDYFQSKEPHTYILKPRSQSSAIGIHVVSTLEEIRELPETLNNYIMEDFVNYNTMLTSDGIASRGKPIIFSVHEYGEKITESMMHSRYATVSTSHLYATSHSVIDDLLAQTSLVLEVLSTSEYPVPYHFEWFYNSTSHDLFFCEGATRFGGAEIPKLIDCAFDIDIKQCYWDMLLNESNLSTKVVVEPNYYATAFLSYRRRGIVKKLPTRKSTEWLEKYTCYVKQGDRLKEPKNAVENIFNAVFKVKNHEDTGEKIKKCVDMLETEVSIVE